MAKPTKVPGPMKAGKRHYPGEINERFVYVLGQDGVDRFPRCKAVKRCQKWQGHIGAHVI